MTTHEPSQVAPPGPPWTRRVSAGAATGAIFGLLISVIEGRWIAQVNAATGGFFPSFLADVGLVTPLMAVLGALLAGVSCLAWATPPTIRAAVSALRGEAVDGLPLEPTAKSVWAATLALTVAVALLWTTASAQVARSVLASDFSPLTSGAILTAASLSLLALFTVIASSLVGRLGRALESRGGPVGEPLVAFGIAALIALTLVLYGVMGGSVSGTGGFFGIYGILKRQELDLRLSSFLLALAAGIWLTGSFARRVPWWAGVIALLAPLSLTFYGAVSLNGNADLARAVERGAPLGKTPLAIFRRLTDSDGDGSSDWFGGGDCNDHDKAIAPSAEDIPDNGVDEDCSGEDLSLAGLPAPAPKLAPGEKPKYPLPANGNVVLITVDTLRYDLGFAGYERAISPSIDALANRSTVFETAYSLASYTGKSVGPMLIGKYCSETHRNWGHFNKFGKDDTFIAQRVSKAGRDTISVHGHRYFGDFGGLDRGFHVVNLDAAPPKEAKWATDTTVTSERLTDAAIAELEKLDGKKPFFLWVHYLDPHADYKHHREVPSFGNGARALYDNEVAFTDKHIGRLLDYLGKPKHVKKTSILLTSDHGEAFGEHKMWRHGNELWEPLVRVPLIVHVPDAKPNRIKARRSLIDLAPTIAELSNVPPPTDKGSDFFSGQSLLTDVFAPDPAAADERDILVDMPAGPYNESRQAFIHKGLKVIVSQGAKKEMFDLNTDPAEATNIWRKQRKDIEAPYALFKKKLRIVRIERR